MARKQNSRKQSVQLSTVGEYKRKQNFDIQTALKLLRLPNSKWQIDDKGYTFEDNDIKRQSSKDADKTAEK